MAYKFRREIHIARPFGIDISLDQSWFIIFLLLLGNLALLVYPAWHPEWSSRLNWLIASVSAILFFFSILAHELAHSLVANIKEKKVKKITLFIFGGVSNLEKEPESPKEEFLISVVGPLTSFVLGFAFLFFTYLSLGDNLYSFLIIPDLSTLDPLGTLFLWLGLINVLIAGFNLIIGFPLDGGRIFRSIIWFISKDFDLATRVAARTGQGVGILFFFLGLLMVFGQNIPLLGTGIMNGLWSALIGWFLYLVAGAQYEGVVLKNVLKDILVSDIMRYPGIIVKAKMPINEFVQKYLVDVDYNTIPVEDNDGKFVGIIRLKDINSVSDDLWKQKIEEIMIPISDLPFISSNNYLSDVVHLIRTSGLDYIPVFANNNLIGLISFKDIEIHLKQSKRITLNFNQKKFYP